jgi:hypothetical protein
VVDGVALLVAGVQGDQHAPHHLGQLVAQPGGRLPHLLLVHARGQQRPLHVVVVELRLGLGDPAQVLPVHPGDPDHHPVVQSQHPAQPGAAQQVPVQRVDRVVGLGPPQARRLVDPAHQLHGQPLLATQLGVGELGQGLPGDRQQVEEGQRQPPLGDRGPDPLQGQPGLGAGLHQPDPPHVPQPVAGLPVRRPQDPQLDQPPHQLRRHPGPRRQLRLGEGGLLHRHPLEPTGVPEKSRTAGDGRFRSWLR